MHRIRGVVDVDGTVGVAVDAVGGEGGGHELHQSLGAGGAGGGVAAVRGLFHADTGEQRPRHTELGGRVLVEQLDLGGDQQRLVVQRVLPHPRLGQVEPDPALQDTGYRRGVVGADGLFVEGCAVFEHEHDRVDVDAVDGDGEVQVDAGGPAGAALHPEGLSDRNHSSGGDGGVDAGQVPVQGGGAGAVVDDDVVAEPVPVVPCPADGAAGCGDDGALTCGQVDTVVQAGAGAGDRVDAHPEPRRHLVRGVDERDSPLPCRRQRAGAVDGEGGGGDDDQGRDEPGQHQRPREQQRRQHRSKDDDRLVHGQSPPGLKLETEPMGTLMLIGGENRQCSWVSFSGRIRWRCW